MKIKLKLNLLLLSIMILLSLAIVENRADAFTDTPAVPLPSSFLSFFTGLLVMATVKLVFLSFEKSRINFI